jgi:hypothetical protein
VGFFHPITWSFGDSLRTGEYVALEHRKDTKAAKAKVR